MVNGAHTLWVSPKWVDPPDPVGPTRPNARNHFSSPFFVVIQSRPFELALRPNGPARIKLLEYNTRRIYPYKFPTYLFRHRTTPL